MGVSLPEACTLGRKVPLRREVDGSPIIIALPHRVAAMEIVADDLFEELGRHTINDLKTFAALVPHQYRPLLEALYTVRTLMGGEGSI